ncbi:hypothetical protein CesoFtcFv8_000457 [Champsocephalus esox]|uniref:Uncharacterized protein n=1 Tax=Champsocephalus esox TaxID=159716 RepID=A0AAN8D6Z0_9TELE|nr:hypothetical protein CesoFtcFv8_000457 [Champsocephalus esox]
MSPSWVWSVQHVPQLGLVRAACPPGWAVAARWLLPLTQPIVLQNPLDLSETQPVDVPLPHPDRPAGLLQASVTSL